MATKSVYAQYCESKGVKGVGMYIDQTLVNLMQDAADKAGMKRNDWWLQTIIKAVRDAGFEYAVATKESLQDENARLRAQIEEMQANMREEEVEEKAA